MEKQIEKVRIARDSTVRLSLEKQSEQKIKREYEKLDEELMQTFPASDPLSYY
jgi:hypothetical protein